MRNRYTVPGIVLLAFSFDSIAFGSNIDPEGCRAGKLQESDFTRGELVLNDDDIIQIAISEQETFDEIADGEDYFAVDHRILSEYKLQDEDGWKWFAVRALGIFGETEEEADATYSRGNTVNGTYYPASDKLSIWTLFPHQPEGKVYDYWVFVRAPNRISEIVFECATFD